MMKNVANSLYHPALRQLAGIQSAAKLQMFARRIRSPRRMVLSALALILGAIWLSQTLIGMLFRKPADPQDIRLWIPMSLLGYACWHVIKVFTRKPIEPFEWTPTEKEWLIAAPFSREQLIGFRFASIAKAAAVKAACFTLIMLPDLRVLPLAFVGMMLALVFLDLIRMVVEVTAYGTSAKTYSRLRAAVLSMVTVATASGLIVGLYGPASITVKTTSLFGLMLKFVHGLIYIAATTMPGQLALKPFVKFSRIILADQCSFDVFLDLLSASVLVGGLAWLLVRLDRWFQMVRAYREISSFPECVQLSQASEEPSFASSTKPLSIPPRWRGIGTLIWRQTLGVFNYPSEVVVSMILPGILSLLPMAVATTTGSMVLQVAGSLVFYSFLLMPAALRFDFRRDVDRLAVLRALPFDPWATTIGQLATPVIACSVFQLVVLVAAVLIRPFPVLWIMYAMLLLVPVNALIFSLENLIFMLFPYRPNQEGVGVFLRTILTFTGKGLIFAFGVVVAIAWMFAAKQWCGGGPLLFMVGVWTMTSATSLGLLFLIVRTYMRFDPSQDTPPLS